MNELHHLRAALASAMLLATLPGAALGQSRTYTTNADFDEGVLVNVNHDPPNRDQLQLFPPELTQPLPFIAIASTGEGTLVRINVNTGAILGEYRTAPEGRLRGPSRTSVDIFGNVWVGNEAEGDPVMGIPGSVVKIGIVVGGTRANADGSPNPNGGFLAPPFDYNTCVDRDGDGLIRTSRALGDVLAWPDITDGAGGANGLVEDAVDECILVYQRTNGPRINHVSVDAQNNVWVGGYPQFPTHFDLLDGDDGSVLLSFPAVTCGGFGGVVDGAGVLWSASFADDSLMRREIASGITTCIPVTFSFGTGLDTQGNLWNSQFALDSVVKVRPDGTIAPGFPKPTGGATLDRGLAITPIDDHVWIANSNGLDVSRLDNAGNFLKAIDLGSDGMEPTGVAVDSNGKVWVTCRTSSTVKRIDPNGGGDGLGAVDLTIPLGVNAQPNDYSDMTGLTTAGITSSQGLWDVVFDSQTPGARWGRISYTSAEPNGTSIFVETRAAESLAALGGQTFLPVQNGAVFGGVDGRFIEVRVAFRRAALVRVTPVLFDLTIEALPSEDVCRSGQRLPGSLLVFPEFDNRRGTSSLLTVTNVQAGGPNVDVELVYVGRYDNAGAPVDCLEINATRTLTPNDTYSVLTRVQDPDHSQGFVYAFAKRNGVPVVHNGLVGVALLTNALTTNEHQYNAVVYPGIGPEGSPTDADHDGIRDLDNVEYGCSPDELLVPRFLGQGRGISSSLTLLNLTGGTAFTATANLLVYNDAEEVFSASHAFRCWTKVPLTGISNVFLQSFLVTTNNAPNEILGASHVESGWFRIDGGIAYSTVTAFDDPALLGILFESAHGRSASDLPFERGGQENGDLLPQGPHGDL